MSVPLTQHLLYTPENIDEITERLPTEDDFRRSRN